MKKIILASSILLASAASFAAANNVGCGLGTVVMGGQQGLAPQVMAVTTNGTGMQTFGISSGTSGCSQDGVVPSNKIAMSFIEGNQARLAREMAAGQGDTVAGLASVLQVADADAAAFSSTLKNNYGKIFVRANMTGVDVLSNIKQVLASDAALKTYASNI